MFDFLYTPVPFWVFGILAISTMWELRKYQKKKISVKVKKNKVLAKLNEEVFIFPKQEEIDLSKYDEKNESYLDSFNKKNAKAKTRTGLVSWEVEAKIIHDFRYYQQYLNNCLPDGFIAERTENNYSSVEGIDDNTISFKIFKGRLDIATVDITQDIFMGDEITGLIGNRPSATIAAKLHYSELFNYDVLNNLLRVLSNTHFEEGAELKNLRLDFERQQFISEHLWSKQNERTHNEYAHDENQYEHGMMMIVKFSGTYSKYLQYVKNVGLDRIYIREKIRLDDYERVYGYERVEKN